ncbi:hypothetical protein G5I_00531 [Acromyrmex echinatior]|uniref:Uncharacterized protein n=1 Tax=Acromyrmex echinatior TaxID=103372 RepID=F4W540_ACREC|nr:hypothetical protein G5I_00531 [Acromyrmex echinatior]
MSPHLIVAGFHVVLLRTREDMRREGSRITRGRRVGYVPRSTPILRESTVNYGESRSTDTARNGRRNGKAKGRNEGSTGAEGRIFRLRIKSRITTTFRARVRHYVNGIPIFPKSKYSFAYRILETPVPGSENAGRDTCVIVSAMWVTLDGTRNGNGWGRLIIVDNGATTSNEIQEKRQNGDCVSRSTFKSTKRFTTEESNGTFYSSNPLTWRGPSGGTLDYKGATFSSQATTRQIVDVDNRRIRSGAKEEEDEVSFSRGSCHHSGTSSAHQSPSFAKETIRRSFVASIES